jgi:hypothetical protein
VNISTVTNNSSGAGTDHNTLSNLQGGTIGEYYHITSAEKTVVTNTSGVNTGDQNLSGYATLTGTETLTNKRITKRAPAITQSATPTINTDVTDVAHITGLAQAITSFTTNLSGTPVEGDMLRIDITDN